MGTGANKGAKYSIPTKQELHDVIAYDFLKDLDSSNVHEELNSRQVKFCQIYVETMEKEQSAILAGYAKSSAAKTANTLLKNPLIVEYIQSLHKDIVITSRVRKESIVSQLMEIAHLARKRGQLNAATSALTQVAKMLGYTSDVINHKMSIEKDDDLSQAFKHMIASTFNVNPSEIENIVGGDPNAIVADIVIEQEESNDMVEQEVNERLDNISEVVNEQPDQIINGEVNGEASAG